MVRAARRSEAETGADVALEAAAHLASSSGETLTVLVVADTADAADALQARITEHLVARQIVPRFLRAPRLELGELCALTHRSDADLLVIDAESPVIAGQARGRLLEDVGCAILLVR